MNFHMIRNNNATKIIIILTIIAPGTMPLKLMVKLKIKISKTINLYN